jgi:hypothetical protein
MGTSKLTLFSFFLVTQICFAQWEQVGLDGYSINDIAVQNSNIFAVTSNSGKVYRSMDNGTNWTMIVDSCARDVEISNAGKIFVVVKDSMNGANFEWKSLHYSTDNGDTWIWSNIMEQISDSLPNVFAGYCPYNMSVGPTGIIFCYVAQRGGFGANFGNDDYFGISSDDGLTWSTPVGFSDNRGGALFDFRNQSALTYGILMYSGSVGNYLSFSSNYGITWEVIAGPEGASVIGIFSNGNIILSGPWNLPGIQISTDMCSTWTQISTVSGQVSLSYSVGLEEGIVVSIDNLGLFLFSDEGDSLGLRNEGLTNLNVQVLTLDNNGYVYAGTENGVWRRPLSEITSMEEEEIDEIPTEFSLSQNYPNPFNPSTKISWQSQVGSWQTLKIYDVLGTEVATLVDDYKPAGTYELAWNAENLPSGVYFYQLKAVDPSTGSGQVFIQTKKMLLLK